ncbi:hypothetical protein DMUE_5301, partial [Dictyocoela muelleri]
KKTLVYRCINSTCRKRKALINTKLNFPTLVHIIYLLLARTSYKQLFWDHGISEATIRQIKKRLIHCYYKYSSERPVYLGEPSEIVEIDETVLCRRGIIRYPTTADDELKDTIWILGAIEAKNKKNYNKESRKSPGIDIDPGTRRKNTYILPNLH